MGHLVSCRVAFVFRVELASTERMVTRIKRRKPSSTFSSAGFNRVLKARDVLKGGREDEGLDDLGTEDTRGGRKRGPDGDLDAEFDLEVKLNGSTFVY